MIEAISPEEGRLRDAAIAAAATNFRPLIPAMPQVRPDPELVRSIGTSTDADAFRGASPDLQSLLDALLSNFGTEHDLVDAEAKDRETEAEIKENNEESREAVGQLQTTAREGEETVGLDRRVDDRRTRFESEDLKVEDFDSEQLQGEAETRLDQVEGRVDEAESLSSRAQDVSGKVGLEARKAPGDEDKLKRSAELREQKAAAAESAARLHRTMVEKVLRKAREQAEKERVRKREQEALQMLGTDTEFANRLREMNKVLQGLR